MNQMFLGLARAYEQTGPVVRIGPPGRETIVLVGPRANQLLALGVDRYFSSREFYVHFAEELGTQHFVVALDGAPHRAMRHIMRPAFTWEAVATYLPTIGETTQRLVQSWAQGSSVNVPTTCRELITDQTALSMTGQIPGKDFEAVSRFFKTAVHSTLGRYDTAALRDPAYTAARKQVHALMRRIIEDHRDGSSGEDRDYIDLLLEGRKETGEPLTEDELVAAALVPFFAGIDTVAYTLSFLLYHVLRDTRLRDRIRAETDGVFSSGVPDLETLRGMTALRNATLETLRLYPVAPPAVRTVVEAFEFAGQQIEAGQSVVIATPVAHFLPELFPDPMRFDIDRFSPPRNEHRPPGAFVPFFKGPHTCIGAGLGEVQIMLTAGLIIHRADLELEPAGYELQLVADPVLRPTEDFAARVVAHRA